MEKEKMLDWLKTHLEQATEEQLRKIFIVAAQILK